MIANGNVRDAVADWLDDHRAFVPQHRAGVPMKASNITTR